jgi:dnd system-associated protein 4
MSEDSWPRDVRIPEEKQPKFAELTDSTDSPFHNWEKNELFVFAASFGFDRGLRTQLEDSSHALFQWNQLDDTQLWMVKSMAVKERESPEILDDGGQIDTLVREYANGGIDRIYEMYVGTGDIFTTLTDDVIELSDK